MQLNSEGKLAKFYMFFTPDDKQLPQDFCTYFWGLVGRVVFVLVMGSGALLALIYGIVSVSKSVWAHKAATLFILGLILFMALVIWLSRRKKKIKIEFLSETRAIIRGKVDSVKNRYCPRIEWKEGPQASAGRGDADHT